MATPCVGEDMGEDMGSSGVRGGSARAPIAAASAKPANTKPPANSALMARPADGTEGRIISLIMVEAYANPGAHKAGGRGRGREFPLFSRRQVAFNRAVGAGRLEFAAASMYDRRRALISGLSWSVSDQRAPASLAS